MCNPADSSVIYNSWANQLDNEFVKDYTDNSPRYFQIIKDVYVERDGEHLLHQVLQHPLRFLKLIGGEPLLNKKMLQILAHLPKQKKSAISLFFVTNGSVDLVDVIQLLGGFKHIGFLLSLEATGNMQEYLRKNSKWSDICNNVDRYLQSESNNIKSSLTVATVSQTLSVWHYPELNQWCSDRGLSIDTTLLTQPDYLSFASMPPAVTSAVIKKLSTMKNFDIVASSMIDNIRNAKFDPVLHNKLTRFIKWYDPNLTLLDYSSIWEGIFTP
jgi:sulfatase maturation enzyme AslB (radical SAM superfamily)